MKRPIDIKSEENDKPKTKQTSLNNFFISKPAPEIKKETLSSKITPIVIKQEKEVLDVVSDDGNENQEQSIEVEVANEYYGDNSQEEEIEEEDTINNIWHANYKYKNTRVTYTTKIPNELRRLDTLARILETSSENCAAVCLINDRLFTTLNNISESKKKSKSTIKHVKSVLNYFSEVAKGNLNESTREDIFKAILTKRVASMKKGVLGLEAHHIEKVAEIFLKKETKEQLEKLKEDLEENSDTKTKASMPYAFELARLLQKDFEKLEARLQSTDEKFLPLKNALSTTTSEVQISRKSILGWPKNSGYFIAQQGIVAVPPIHAEMRLVDYLLDFIEKNKIDPKPSTIYLGLSKLCCHHCAVALQAVNNVLERKNYGIKFLTRGFHGLRFPCTSPGFLGNKKLSKKDNTQLQNLATSSSDLKREIFEEFNKILMQVETNSKIKSKTVSMYDLSSSGSVEEPSLSQGEENKVQSTKDEGILTHTLELQTKILGKKLTTDENRLLEILNPLFKFWLDNPDKASFSSPIVSSLIKFSQNLITPDPSENLQEAVLGLYNVINDNINQTTSTVSISNNSPTKNMLSFGIFKEIDSESPHSPEDFSTTSNLDEEKSIFEIEKKESETNDDSLDLGDSDISSQNPN